MARYQHRRRLVWNIGGAQAAQRYMTICIIDVKNLQKGIKTLKNQDLTQKIKNLKKP